MNRFALVSRVVLSLAVFVAGGLQAQTNSEPNPAPSEAAPGKPYEDVIKLWKANLSEDFIKRQIQTGNVVYNLSADEVIKLRDAGLPEGLINVMLDTPNRRDGKMPTGMPAPVTARAGDVPSPALSLAAEANRRWDGLARRNGGVVIFKGRWDVGTLEFKEETLRWLDAKDPSKNLLIPAKQITEQFMTCLKKSGGNECFEWGVKTKDGEYKFRDVSWEQSENKRVLEVFEFMKGIYPSLVSSNVPVDSK